MGVETERTLVNLFRVSFHGYNTIEDAEALLLATNRTPIRTSVRKASRSSGVVVVDMDD